MPPGLFSDMEFLTKCNRSVTRVVGHKLAQWLTAVQIPEYWGVSGVGGRVPTNWQSPSMPPVVFDLPDGCHEWKLEAIYRFYATSPLFSVLARHSPISANNQGVRPCLIYVLLQSNYVGQQAGHLPGWLSF